VRNPGIKKLRIIENRKKLRIEEKNLGIEGKGKRKRKEKGGLGNG
jgi:hypothetical protein